MKCFFAVPSAAAARVERACAAYAQDLDAWAPSAPTMADDLARLVEELASSQLRLGDDDWKSLRAKLDARSKGQALAQIFWRASDTARIADAVETLGSEATPRDKALLAWLHAEVDLDSVVVALTR